MSGEPTVFLVGEEMHALVSAAARLAQAAAPRCAVIGGVAVAVRLGRAHRATADLDTVADDDVEPALLAVIGELENAHPDPERPNRVYLGATKVEVIGTNAVAHAALRNLEDLEILFVGGHRWALESATLITLVADGGTTATIRVAAPAALVAMKLHAPQSRRSGVIDKRSGDAWDIFRLLADLDHEGDVASQYSTAPEPLRTSVAAAVQNMLIDNVARTRRWLAAGDDRMRAATTDEIAHVARAFLVGLG